MSDAEGGAPEKEPEPLCDCGHRMSSHGPMGCWVDRDNDVFCACTVDPERQAGQSAGEPERATETSGVPWTWLDQQPEDVLAFIVDAAISRMTIGRAQAAIRQAQELLFSPRVLRGAAPSAPEGQEIALKAALRECLIESPHSEGARPGCLCRWCKARRLLGITAPLMEPSADSVPIPCPSRGPSAPEGSASHTTWCASRPRACDCNEPPGSALGGFSGSGKEKA